MDKKEKSLLDDFPNIQTLIALGGLVGLLLLFLVFTMTSTGRNQNNHKQYPVPLVVSEFLDAITAPDADIEKVLNNYVVTTVIESDSSGEIGGIRDVLSFEYVLSVQNSTTSGFILKDSTEGYLEFCVLDSRGKETYPRIAFAYILTEDGTKIADYTIGRLQPFSRLDAEYDERWNS